MRTIEQEAIQKAINEAQKRAFDKCVAEAQKSDKAHQMKMHEISKIHAEALLKVDSFLVYGCASLGFVRITSIDELTKFEQYFID